MRRIYYSALYSASFFVGNLICYTAGIITIQDALIRSYFMAVATIAIVTTVEKV